MGSKGDCFDDAIAESFFATLKKELVYREGPWPTRSALTSAIFEWIEVFYNRERRHSTPGYLSPEQHEQESLNQKMKKKSRPNQACPEKRGRSSAAHSQGPPHQLPFSFPTLLLSLSAGQPLRLSHYIK